MKPSDLTSVSGELVAKVLGIPRRTHTSLVRKEVLPKSNRNRKYDLPASVAAYVEYRVNDATPSTAADEKRRVLKETADKLALANERQRGKLVYVDDVSSVLNRIAALLVLHLEAFPGRAVAALAAISDEAERRQILLGLTRDVRQYLADFLTEFPDPPEGLNANQQKAIKVLIGAAEDDDETE